jgi:hypothetical protein
MKKEMKLYMCRELEFWIEVEVSREASRHPDLPEQELIARALHEFERAGDAMRYLRADGKIGWKATPWMLDRLADAEREAVDDLEHHGP